MSLPLSLEWHVWLSSSGNNCHAVHRSLSSGASVWLYRGILPCPILSTKPAYTTGICIFRVFGMACFAGSKVNIQQCSVYLFYGTYISDHLQCRNYEFEIMDWTNIRIVFVQSLFWIHSSPENDVKYFLPEIFLI